MSGASVAVLKRMAKVREGSVSPGTGAMLSSMGLLTLLRRTGHGDLTADGFRSTSRGLGSGADKFTRASPRDQWALARTECYPAILKSALASGLTPGNAYRKDVTALRAAVFPYMMYTTVKFDHPVFVGTGTDDH